MKAKTLPLLILGIFSLVIFAGLANALVFDIEPIRKQTEETKKCTEDLTKQFNKLDKKVLENSLNDKFIKEALIRIEKLLDDKK